MILGKTSCPAKGGWGEGDRAGEMDPFRKSEGFLDEGVIITPFFDFV